MATMQYLKFPTDGHSEDVIFLSEPEHRMGKYGKDDRHEFCFPVATVRGLECWTVGKMLCRLIYTQWDKFHKNPIRVTRRGGAGDTSTIYDLEPLASSKPLKEILEHLGNGELEHMVAALKSGDSNGEKVPF